MKKSATVALSISLLLGLTGCLHTVDSVENYHKESVPNEVIRLHVETDASQPVKVSNLLEKTAPNGFKQIAVEFTNYSSKARTIFYRCEWFDESGIRVETSLTQWTEGRFAARDSKQMLFTAPNDRAKDFKIRISEDVR